MLVHEDWTYLAPNLSSTQLVEAFEKYTISLVDQIFPEKTVTISNFDLPFMTEELKLMKRQRIRVYNKHGRNQKYICICNQVEAKLKLAAEKYSLNMKNSYSALKKL